MTRASDLIRDRIRNTPPARQQDPRRWRDVFLLLAGLLVLAVPVLFDIAQQARHVRARYGVEALRREKAALDQEYLRLRIERSALESLDAISRRALDDLGMRPSDQGVRVVAPASGAARPPNTRSDG